jgi:hypothetical protein
VLYNFFLIRRGLALFLSLIRAVLSPPTPCSGPPRQTHAHNQGDLPQRRGGRQTQKACPPPLPSSSSFLARAGPQFSSLVCLFISSELSRSSAPALHCSPRSPTRADPPASPPGSSRVAESLHQGRLHALRPRASRRHSKAAWAFDGLKTTRTQGLAACKNLYIADARWQSGLGVAVLCVLLRAYQIKRLCVCVAYKKETGLPQRNAKISGAPKKRPLCTSLPRGGSRSQAPSVAAPSLLPEFLPPSKLQPLTCKLFTEIAHRSSPPPPLRFPPPLSSFPFSHGGPFFYTEPVRLLARESTAACCAAFVGLNP